MAGKENLVLTTSQVYLRVRRINSGVQNKICGILCPMMDTLVRQKWNRQHYLWSDNGFGQDTLNRAIGWRLLCRTGLQKTTGSSSKSHLWAGWLIFCNWLLIINFILESFTSPLAFQRLGQKAAGVAVINLWNDLMDEYNVRTFRRWKEDVIVILIRPIPAWPKVLL